MGIPQLPGCFSWIIYFYVFSERFLQLWVISVLFEESSSSYFIFHNRAQMWRNSDVRRIACCKRWNLSTPTFYVKLPLERLHRSLKRPKLVTQRNSRVKLNLQGHSVKISCKCFNIFKLFLFFFQRIAEVG